MALNALFKAFDVVTSNPVTESVTQTSLNTLETSHLMSKLSSRLVTNSSVDVVTSPVVMDASSLVTPSTSPVMTMVGIDRISGLFLYPLCCRYNDVHPAGYQI